jgi:hypothetical protein
MFSGEIKNIINRSSIKIIDKCLISSIPVEHLIENDSSILSPEKLIVNFEALQILMKRKSFIGDHSILSMIQGLLTISLNENELLVKRSAMDY